jgi:L-lactate dehydrogenase
MANKVVIVGTGNVGMSYAFALLNQRTHADALYLIDINRADADGEVLDLRNCLGFSPSNLKIRSGRYSDCKDADLIVITAGARQEIGETRMDLIQKNAKIFRDMIGEIMSSGFNGIFLVVSNPVDIMTYLTYKYSGLPRAKVIGSGTTLDTSRLMYHVGHELKIDPKSVHAFVIGEHGDSELVAWNEGDIGLESLHSFLSEEQMARIEEKVKNEAYEIIKRKGSTHYGIGMALARITNAILSNENAVLPVSNYDPFSKTFFGYPAVVGRSGIKRRVALELVLSEQRKLEKSIEVLRSAIGTLLG